MSSKMLFNRVASLGGMGFLAVMIVPCPRGMITRGVGWVLVLVGIWGSLSSLTLLNGLCGLSLLMTCFIRKSGCCFTTFLGCGVIPLEVLTPESLDARCAVPFLLVPSMGVVEPLVPVLELTKGVSPTLLLGVGCVAEVLGRSSTASV